MKGEGGELVERGWLFDAYPKGDKTVVWIKRNDGSTISREDDWRHAIYVGMRGSREKFSFITKHEQVAKLVSKYSIERRFERITDLTKSTVLRLELTHSSKALLLAEIIEQLSGDRSGSQGEKLRLYNVDVLPTQAYFYERDIFTLAQCTVHTTSSNRGSALRFTLEEDSQMNTDYELPNLKTVRLNVAIRKTEHLAKPSDRLASISIQPSNDEEGKGEGSKPIVIESQSEADMLVQACLLIQNLDPDFIFTAGGDSFLFPYLICRGEVNGIPIVMGREKGAALVRPSREGNTYFSYGRIHYRPTTVKLRGRVHIDTQNSFILDEAGLQGLYEVARLCRMPLHTASRASIGRCMSSLQFYHAWKKELLVPWKPELSEHYKTFRQLLVADRGGLIYEPELGVHEQAAEFDFASLYPNIMLKKNLSGETVNCACCPDSDVMVPEVDYRICRRIGIVPLSLEILLKKRAKYKNLKNEAMQQKIKHVYDSRQTALKWILVTSFGYLGFNNSKFGRIDAHIAVCAHDRQILRQATKAVEDAGFRVLHGIVDSLWVKKKKDAATVPPSEYLQLKEKIERAVGGSFDISFEGVYKWVVFLPSKAKSGSSISIPVPNRYFGLFEDGKIKVRGIEIRRHDTPEFFAQCQAEALKKMAQGNTKQEVKALMPEVDELFLRHVQMLKSGRVPLKDLVFTKQLSKDSSHYGDKNTIETDAIRQLWAEGRKMKAGEVIRYVVTDYTYHGTNRSGHWRSVPADLIDNLSTTYDVTRYIELLARVYDSVTAPFGHSVVHLISKNEGQKTLIFDC